MSLLRSQRLAAALARAGPSSSLSLATTQLRGLAVAGRVVVGGDSSGGTPQRRRAAPKAVLEMTDTAAERIRGLLERRREREPAIAVRVGIKSRGCNGLSYTMNYALEKAKFEEEVEKDGARIFIESKALMHVIGTRMDFVEDDLSSEFVFHNPNAEAACGCGESFTVADQGKTQANG